MSHAKDLLTGGKGVTRQTYLMSVVSEIVSNYPDDQYRSDDMIRGNELERFALDAFMSQHDKHCETVGFVLHDDERIGCSPDALSKNAVIEIKSPKPETHLKYMNRNYAITAHNPQMQGNMWICEKEACWFVSFCPWVESAPLIAHLVSADYDVISKIEESSLSGADEIEKMVEAIKANKPSKEVIEISKSASEYWSMLTLQNDEVMI